MKTNSRFSRNVYAIRDRIWCNKHLLIALIRFKWVWGQFAHYSTCVGANRYRSHIFGGITEIFTMLWWKTLSIYRISELTRYAHNYWHWHLMCSILLKLLKIVKIDLCGVGMTTGDSQLSMEIGHVSWRVFYHTVNAWISSRPACVNTYALY